MKRLITLLILCLFLLIILNEVKAQTQQDNKDINKNIVTFAPLGLVNKIRFKYERDINDIFTAGSYVSYYYGAYPGTQVEPYIRYYFGDEAPDGIFMQLKLIAGYQKYIFSDVPSNDFYFFSGGAGLSIGYQKLTGKHKNFPIEFSVGFKIVNPPTNKGVANIASGVYLLTGPGSVFDGGFSLGFAF